MDKAEAAIVTGGTGALGSVVARAFLAAGYRVAVTYRGAKEWDALAAAEREAVAAGRLLGLVADVTDDASVGTAVTTAATTFGRLDVLVHVAGGYAGGKNVEALDAKVVRSMIDTNLLSAFWASKHVIPHAKRNGRGRLLLGLHALVQTLAKELKADGVTANAVLPSVIDTAANRVAMPNSKFDEWLKPESIADLLLFLASENAKATSGALIPIYGRA
jgi:NAD(P)-dependent dehydrogenase (short-subunit alcohol dehydrogenase family)